MPISTKLLCTGLLGMAMLTVTMPSKCMTLATVMALNKLVSDPRYGRHADMRNRLDRISAAYERATVPNEKHIVVKSDEDRRQVREFIFEKKVLARYNKFKLHAYFDLSPDIRTAAAKECEELKRQIFAPKYLPSACAIRMAERQAAATRSATTNKVTLPKVVRHKS